MSENSSLPTSLYDGLMHQVMETRKRKREEDDEGPAPSASMPSLTLPQAIAAAAPPPAKAPRKNLATKATAKPAANAKPKKAATAAAALGYCSLSKKDFGDQIKAALALEKYAVQSMCIPVKMDVAFFRSFFGANAKITPAEYNNETPVVVAELSNAQAGAVFGVSKIKNGNRYETVHLAMMCIVFYPPTGQAKAWLTV